MIVWGGVAVPAARGSAQQDFAVHVVGERIVAVGPRAALQAQHPEEPVFGAADLLLLPGLINSHDHGRGLGTFPLGVPDDMLEVWLPSLWALPPLDPYKLALVEGTNLLHSGVTATAHSHNPGDWGQMEPESAAALRGYGETGIRVAYHPPFVDQNPLVYAGRREFLEGLPADVRQRAEPFLRPPSLRREDYFALCDQLYAQHHDAAGYRIHIQISPAGGQWCSDELIVAACTWAQARGTRVQMHLLETRYQAAYAARRWGRSFVRHLDALGALGPWLTLAHMVWVDEQDVAILAARQVAVVHNPSSNLRLRSGVAPLPTLLAAGVSLGIGLDGCALDDDQDYLRELRLAWTLANRPGAGAAAIAAGDVLHLGTSGGAAATFGAHAPLGRLAPGALADLVLLDWRAVEGIWASPSLAPAELLLRRGSKHQVRHVMVGGDWVLRDGRSTRVDEAAVHAELRAELQHYAAEHGRGGSEPARILAPYIRRFYAGWDG